MKFLKKLQNVPIIKLFVKKIIKFIANRKVKTIAVHFSQFLVPVFASTEKLKVASFSVRHQVYCEELKFEEVHPNKQEIDEFDEHSFHCIIQHKSSGKTAGTVRVVYSSNENQLLPIEKYCKNAIGNEHLLPDQFPRHKICEVSRLAVPAEFRKRAMDKFEGAATGVINEQKYSEKELRCFPFIAVGLYLSATAILTEKGIDHCYVMMEPRLARSLRLVGVPFQQIGPVVDYHGKRAPYYVDPREVARTVSPGFGMLLKTIENELKTQL